MPDKKHRHDQEKDRPQSTDAKDAALDEDEAKEVWDAESKRQRESQPQDVTGRIIGYSIEGDRTKLAIGMHTEGLKPGTEGYIKAGNGMLARFKIAIYSEKRVTAYVDVTPDMLKDHDQVVVNPSSFPESSEERQDIKTRVMGVVVDGGKTKISLGIGNAHGAREGMRGYLVDSGGKPFAEFTVTEARARSSHAFVHATVDEVYQCSSAMLNPTTMPQTKR